MSVSGILIAAAVVGGSGLLIGIFLGVFGEKFKVEVDEKETGIREKLPGNNCGGCGYAGCDALAAAIAKGEASTDACPVGGSPVAEAIAGIMGVSAGGAVKKVAFVRCAGNCEKAKERYEYYGTEDCRSASVAAGGGSKACTYGCMGYGSCVKACPFDAIHIVDGIAVVDKEACRACGKCIAVCPKQLIELVPYDAAYLVQCHSQDKGKDVMQKCLAGCIACHLCEKNCPAAAVTVENNIAHIDTALCIQCGQCADKCPKGIITGKKETEKKNGS